MIVQIKELKDIMSYDCVVENGNVKFKESGIELPLKIVQDIEDTKQELVEDDGSFIYSDEESGDKYILPDELIMRVMHSFECKLKSVDAILRDSEIQFVCNPFNSGLTKHDSNLIMTEPIMKAAALELELIVDVLPDKITDGLNTMIIREVTNAADVDYEGIDDLVSELEGYTISKWMINIPFSIMMNLITEMIESGYLSEDEESKITIKDIIDSNYYLYSTNNDSFSAAITDVPDDKLLETLKSMKPEEINELFKDEKYLKFDIKMFEDISVIPLSDQSRKIIEQKLNERQ